ncbi:carbohydrate porin [Amylibacter sp. SFDW26]|uniref:carbohydrate porin n=1 Tax=Amylibacter sp. SFDW26 TaxID=2652722 RepID=UPI001261CF64|nr:carbohydrate porin [Amylibacter sp. SFDW26]KAB7610163.1 carbohydrate porin [Amylibacter sp. SFDW26]
MINIKKTVKCFAVANITVASLAGQGLAEDIKRPSDGFDPDKFLTGDWGGARQILLDKGLSFTGLYINQAATNLKGGTSTELIYSDMFLFGVDADLDRLVGIPNTTLHATVTNRNGDNLVEEANLGTNLLVNEVFGQGNFTRLNHLFLNTKLYDDKLELKYGRISGSFDFHDFSCNFQNLTFCGAIPSYLTPNWTPFPGHTWGAVATWKPTKDFYFKAGISEINSDFDRPQNARRIEGIGQGEGSRYNTEIGYSPKIAGKPGSYKFGVFWDDVGAQDVADATINHSDQLGYYLNAQQEIWSDSTTSGRKVDLFFNYVQADEDVAALESVVEAGIFFQGPVKSRPQDELGFAVGLINTSSKLTAADIAAGGTVRDKEFPMEIYYSFRLKRGITIQPNLQYIVNPGGISSNEDVAVLGLKTVFNF